MVEDVCCQQLFDVGMSCFTRMGHQIHIDSVWQSRLPVVSGSGKQDQPKEDAGENACDRHWTHNAMTPSLFWQRRASGRQGKL
jgi:hypothetical protein